MCDVVDAWSRRVEQKKRLLDSFRASLPTDCLARLEHHHRIDITYTSHALEGNALTAGETALVLEKGIAIGGKPIEHHLEVMDHARALDLVVDMALKDKKDTTARSL